MKFFRRSSLHLALAVAAWAPLPVLAAGSATVASGDDVSQVRWLDAQTVRIDSPSQDGYMVLRDGKLYVIDADPSGEAPQVMEISGMMRDMADMAAQSENGASSLSREVVSVEASGQSETVADIQGEVFKVTYQDDDGETNTVQAVLTDDPLVVELTDAYLAAIGTMLGPDHLASFEKSLPKDKRGLLRSDDDMVVQDISSKAPAADLFELPSEPQDLGALMQGMLKQMQQQMEQMQE